MNLPKKVIEVIDTFHSIFFLLKNGLYQENIDYILDVSGYVNPAVVLSLSRPDVVLLNLKLPAAHAVEMMKNSMQGHLEINLAMITTDSSMFYMSLCSSFESEYCIGLSSDIEVAAHEISQQQLN